ncbi:MAG: hypothetical protein HYZ93_03000, partial [Candidatus Omnitrophica bacterium]|nr:hypothetical protein [Candidatus Omnitrophota bacterium]
MFDSPIKAKPRGVLAVLLIFGFLLESPSPVYALRETQPDQSPDIHREMSRALTGLEEKFPTYDKFVDKSHNRHITDRTKALKLPDPGGAIWHDIEAVGAVLSQFMPGAPSWAKANDGKLRELLKGDLDRLAESYQRHYEEKDKEQPGWRSSRVMGEVQLQSHLEQYRASASVKWFHSIGFPLDPRGAERLINDRHAASFIVASFRGAVREVVVFETPLYLIEKAGKRIGIPAPSLLGKHLFSMGVKVTAGSVRAYAAVQNARIAEERKQKPAAPVGPATPPKSTAASSGEMKTLPAGPALPLAPETPSPALEQIFERELLYPLWTDGPKLSLRVVRRRWWNHPERDRWPFPAMARFLARRFNTSEEEVKTRLDSARQRMSPLYPFANDRDVDTLIGMADQFLRQHPHAEDPTREILAGLDRREKLEGPFSKAVDQVVFRLREGETDHGRLKQEVLQAFPTTAGGLEEPPTLLLRKRRTVFLSIDGREVDLKWVLAENRLLRGGPGPKGGPILRLTDGGNNFIFARERYLQEKLAIELSGDKSNGLTSFLEKSVAEAQKRSNHPKEWPASVPFGIHREMSIFFIPVEAVRKLLADPLQPDAVESLRREAVVLTVLDRSREGLFFSVARGQAGGGRPNTLYLNGREVAGGQPLSLSRNARIAFGPPAGGSAEPAPSNVEGLTAGLEELSEVGPDTLIREGDTLVSKSERVFVRAAYADGSVRFSRLGADGEIESRIETRPRERIIHFKYKLANPVFVGAPEGMSVAEAAAQLRDYQTAHPSLREVYFAKQFGPKLYEISFLSDAALQRFTQDVLPLVPQEGAKVAILQSGPGRLVVRRAAGLEEAWEEQLRVHSPASYDLLQQARREVEEKLYLGPTIPSPRWVTALVGDQALAWPYVEGTAEKPLYPKSAHYGSLTQAHDRWMNILRRLYVGSGTLDQEYRLNVTPLSGVLATLAAYGAIPVGGRVMGLHLLDGGQMSEGNKGSFSSKFYQSVPIPVTPTGDIDYKTLRAFLLEMEVGERPDLLIVAGTAFPYPIDFTALRRIVNQVNQNSARRGSSKRMLFLADISQNLAQMVGGGYNSPIGLADFVSFSLRHLGAGEGGMVLSREEWSKQVNKTVFPGFQAGFNAGAVAAKGALADWILTDRFQALARRIRPNARAFAERLKERGVKVRGDGDVHFVLIDPRPYGLNGRQAQDLLWSVGISAPENPFRAPPGEGVPSILGNRLSVAAPTFQGMREPQIRQVADFIVDTFIHREDPPALERIRSEVRALLKQFPVESIESAGTGLEEGRPTNEEASEALAQVNLTVPISWNRIPKAVWVTAKTDLSRDVGVGGSLVVLAGKEKGEYRIDSIGPEGLATHALEGVPGSASGPRIFPGGARKLARPYPKNSLVYVPPETVLQKILLVSSHREGDDGIWSGAWAAAAKQMGVALIPLGELGRASDALKVIRDNSPAGTYAVVVNSSVDTAENVSAFIHQVNPDGRAETVPLGLSADSIHNPLPGLDVQALEQSGQVTASIGVGQGLRINMDQARKLFDRLEAAARDQLAARPSAPSAPSVPSSVEGLRAGLEAGQPKPFSDVAAQGSRAPTIGGKARPSGRATARRVADPEAVRKTAGGRQLPAGLEEIRSALMSFVPSSVRLGEVHIFDPENADVGRVVAALVKDPVVIIAEDAKQEELLLRYGFSGPGRYIV